MSGVSLLELARPPDGYRTIAAVATTYSADLVACLALLVALDGNGDDRLKYNKIEALRALERLRGHVRIVAQQNRVEYHGASGLNGSKLLALCDSVLRTVPFHGRRQSFHPKVFVARQQKLNKPDRYVLAVGSRNLTASSAWDFGIGLVGYALPKRPPGTRRLENLDQFVTLLGSLIAEPSLGVGLGNLNDVSWELPPLVTSIVFHFHADRVRSFEETQLADLPTRGRALLISPFLTPTIVQHIADHFAKADEVRLVSGKSELDHITASKARVCIRDGGPIRAYSMLLAPDDASSGSTDDEDPEQTDCERGLHAKVFCVTVGNAVTAIIGSANLTAHAWTGTNWEAFLVLRGSNEIADELWNWSGLRAHPYRPDASKEIDPETVDSIDELRNDLAEVELLLSDFDGQPSLLESAKVGMILSRHGCTLEVARFTTPELSVPWPTDVLAVPVPACEPSERTAFVIMRARKASNESTWIQTVKIEPPLSDDRDRQAFVRILGIDDFLRYLRGILDDPEGEPDDPLGNRSSGRRRVLGPKDEELFRFEDLLRRLNRDQDALNGLDETIRRYGDLFERSATQPEEKDRLRRFLSLYTAISAGMRMA